MTRFPDDKANNERFTGAGAAWVVVALGVLCLILGVVGIVVALC